ncbi:preprotein translocase subunit YajC [Ancylomarina sp. 16SWW S1-10-2]|uniref:preprotein translocase subunit YajC n=1 Tax=Ancylomarina sp. 16SWW S1-10-2 TaxID=2499681 RepID=UPI001E49FC9B|nr:preprotein translocase subunit YajC [Ancylomarina sp. 16SWW S1-10-2]
MLNLLNIVLMTQPQEGQSPYGSLLMLGAIVVVFYFFMIRPQMKRQKDLKKFREELKKGDKIVTTGGIYGKIIEMQETTVIMEVEGKSRLKIDKVAIIKDMSDVAQK